MMSIDKVVPAIVSATKQTSPFYMVGIEREGLRVSGNGKLSKNLHPEEFGEKLENFHIKTDFCEAQPELVTNPNYDVLKTYEELEKLTNTLHESISEKGELYWCQSMPCILPKEENIKTAIHNGDFAEPLREYLEKLREKYGAKPQLLSGVHYNFSFTDTFFENLRRELGYFHDLQTLKNEYYMKIIKNYIKYSWFIILLTGASPAVHKSFDNKLDSLEKIGDCYVGENAVSLRMSKMGYHNKVNINIDYTSVETYTKSLKKAVKKGKLIDAGELFAPIKPKVKRFTDPIKGLKNDGILYLELRNIDINVFDKCGISKEDMEFIPLFIMFLMMLGEAECKNWQEEARKNAFTAAETGRDRNFTITHHGVDFKAYAHIKNLLVYLKSINKMLEICSEKTMNSIEERLMNPEKNYSHKVHQKIMEDGFIDTHLKLCEEYMRD